MYRLERSETYEVTTPFVEDYRTTGDAATFAQAYTNFFRAFTEPVLRIAFSSCADIDALVHRFPISNQIMRQGRACMTKCERRDRD